MSELKPCHFCGGKAKTSMRKVRDIGENERGDKKIQMGAQVICNRCKARGPLYSEAVVNPYSVSFEKIHILDTMKKKAEEAWNRRDGV